MSVKGGKVPARVVPEDLPQVVRELACEARGLTPKSLERNLPVPYRKFRAEVKAVLEAMVAAGELVALVLSKKAGAVYFAEDPSRKLDALVREKRPEPLREQDLKRWVAALAPGYEVAFGPWLKGAVARKVLFKHRPLPPTKGARYGTEPDVAALLSSTLRALGAALPKIDAEGIARRRVADALLAALGLPALESNGMGRDFRAELLDVVERLSAEDPSSALLAIRAVRRRLPLSKRDFDRLVLELRREGLVTLHYHDFPAALSASERDELVIDEEGTHYVGIAWRGAR